MFEFRMPSLGSDMEDGTLIEWLAQPGQHVDTGEAIAVVETHKGAIEVESFRAGKLFKLVGKLEEKVPVGTLLALLLEEGEDEPDPAQVEAMLAAEAAAAHAKAHAADDDAPTASAPASPAGAPSAPRGRASPRARRRADELGVDLESLVGTGPGGAITGEDVERAAGPRAPATEDPGLGLRRTIAATMARANREIPHYYLEHTLDLEPALSWLEARNAARPVTERVLPAALLLRASALAFARHSELNGYWIDDRPQLATAVHLGVVISLRGGGVVAPAILDAQDRSLDDLMLALRDLVARARARRLRSSEMSDATATVTNLGDRGVEAVFPVIFPPQLAILGFGAVLTRPWVADGAVVPRRVLRASMAGDHRATDGHAGARLIATLETLLLEPEQL